MSDEPEMTDDEKRFYCQFYRAARKKDRDRIVQVLRERPDLHGITGNAGGLVRILHREAPEHLEAAFEAGLHPDAGPLDSLDTMLVHAACDGDVGLIRLCLRYGADPERRTLSGEVALGYAATWGQLEAVKALVEGGADVNAIEEDPETGCRNTPLDCTQAHPEIAEYLRSMGALHLSELEPGSNEGGPQAT